MKKGGKRSGRKNPKVFYLNWIGIREVCRRIGFLGWKLNALEEKKKGGDGANAFFWFNSMISTIIIILLLFIFIFSLLFFLGFESHNRCWRSGLTSSHWQRGSAACWDVWHVAKEGCTWASGDCDFFSTSTQTHTIPSFSLAYFIN